MFLSRTISAPNMPNDQVEDGEEEDVFQQTWEETPAKTFSIEKAVQYVYGQSFCMEVKTLTEDEKEANERANYCRKQLLRLENRRAAQEAGEANRLQISQRETVEEWLANIELGLSQRSQNFRMSAAQVPIWIAREKRKFGNLASAAKATATAVRLNLRGREIFTKKIPESSPIFLDDERLLNVIMEDFEELSVKGDGSELTSTDAANSSS